MTTANVAVLLNKDAPPAWQCAAPAEWPVQVQENPTSIESPWVCMTIDELEQHKAALSDEYAKMEAQYAESIKRAQYAHDRRKEFEQLDGELLDGVCLLASRLKDNGIDIGEDMDAMLETRRKIKIKYPKPDAQ